MSWEEMYRRDYPCKCGKGTYTEVGEMDDWNRTRDYKIINCSECNERARIAVEKEIKAKAEREANLKILVEEISTHFEKHYMEDWLSYFENARNKKEVWSLATKTGVESYSLSAFYDHNKGSNKEDYVRRLARPNNMLKIIETLNINDDLLNSKVKEAMDLKGSSYVIGFY
ncbi:hypothetical protein M3175_17200 [Robertmurraya korlensis]|uniref:hypothetical protein n=1 Tax=Robertmurraya korlensis TaxID=519977 RepID=UPI002041F2BC|nr:hypothetical protein [Robertmurraya korlensis]MCM3602473.1 hypothetical protein [Robertmurraya korlensis]